MLIIMTLKDFWMSVDFNKLEHEIKAEISIRKRNSKDCGLDTIPGLIDIWG